MIFKKKIWYCRFRFSKYQFVSKYQYLSMSLCVWEREKESKRVRFALFSPQEVNISLSCLASDVVTHVTLLPCVAVRWRWIINGQPLCTLLHWTESAHIHTLWSEYELGSGLKGSGVFLQCHQAHYCHIIANSLS